MESILRIEQIEKYYGNKLNLTKAIDKDGPVFRCDELDELPNEY